MFDESYIEQLYRQYVSLDYDDTQSKNWLSSQLKGNNIVVQCPGKTLAEYQESILDFITQNKSMVFSVNFVPDFVLPDCIFCANVKRLPNIIDTKGVIRVITSNLIEDAEDHYEHAFSFNDYVYFNEEFCEDSTLMLLKILMECGCENIAVAGFDGFQENTENYYIPNYTREDGKNITVKTVKHILDNALEKIKVRFLTPSAYNHE